jgi:hypothetical protein
MVAIDKNEVAEALAEYDRLSAARISIQQAVKDYLAKKEVVD